MNYYKNVITNTYFNQIISSSLSIIYAALLPIACNVGVKMI